MRLTFSKHRCESCLCSRSNRPCISFARRVCAAFSTCLLASTRSRTTTNCSRSRTKCGTCCTRARTQSSCRTHRSDSRRPSMKCHARHATRSRHLIILYFCLHSLLLLDFSISLCFFFKSIRYGFSNQITDAESRLSNSTRRLHDSIVELSNRTVDLIDEFKADQKTQSSDVRDKLEKTQKRLEGIIEEQARKTNNEFKHTHDFFTNSLNNTEQRITGANKNFF